MAGEGGRRFASGRLLIAEENRLYAAGVYHCQQTAEKALKAWLTCCDIVFPKTHDLEALLHLCRTREPGFSAYAEHARVLTPLATCCRQAFVRDGWQFARQKGTFESIHQLTYVQ